MIPHRPTGGRRVRAVVPQAQVRAALEAGELRLHYQPIVDLDSGRVHGVEGLLRWEHPSGGLLSPDHFLPAVARSPVMHDITRWVLDHALHDLRGWPGWSVSLNVSALDVVRPRLVRDVEQALAAHDVDPHRLVLELTEQAVVQDIARAAKVVGELRSLGVSLSLDDFGTGYSSLLYLRDLPINELKIDRTFVAPARRSRQDIAIVKSVAQLGRSLGLRVVAEGVETLALARVVREARCTAGQGYLWGAPRPAAELDASLQVVVPRLAAARCVDPVPAPGRAQERALELLGLGASLRTIAAALNREGLRTEKGARWTPTSVALVIASQTGPPPMPYGGS